MPRVLAYLRATCHRYHELHPLLRLLDRLDDVEARAGYTF
jgi:aminoglycoside/choline kinase family phosphotransferase